MKTKQLTLNPDTISVSGFFMSGLFYLVNGQ